jgi:hypothetical protein
MFFILFIQYLCRIKIIISYYHPFFDIANVHIILYLFDKLFFQKCSLFFFY